MHILSLHREKLHRTPKLGQSLHSVGAERIKIKAAEKNIYGNSEVTKERLTAVLILRTSHGQVRVTMAVRGR